jgi:hypothetical protein
MLYYGFTACQLFRGTGTDENASGRAEMKRREFMLALSGVAAGLPFSVRAQQIRRLPTVGVLMTVAENDLDSQRRVAAFRQGFADLGWKEPLAAVF